MRAHINHVAMRTMRPDAMAEFYRDVFELAPSNVDKAPGDANHYLTDGQRDLGDHAVGHHRLRRHRHHHARHGSYRLQGGERRGVQGRRQADRRRQSPAGAAPVGTGKEGAALARLFARSCSLGQHCMADPDGILIDVMAD